MEAMRRESVPFSTRVSRAATIDPPTSSPACVRGALSLFDHCAFLAMLVSVSSFAYLAWYFRHNP